MYTLIVCSRGVFGVFSFFTLSNITYGTRVELISDKWSEREDVFKKNKHSVFDFNTDNYLKGN